MTSAGTNDLLEAVEKATGFKVAVDTIECIVEDVRMNLPCMASMGKSTTTATDTIRTINLWHD